MTNIYRIAELRIQIRSLHEDVHRLCAEYRAEEGPVDFVAETSQEDIAFERLRSARQDEREGREVRAFSDGYLETLAVYRKIAERAPAYDTVLMHGSCVAVDGNAYLFTAKSGTGKSTHARLWREMLGERAVMVNDDKPLIRLTQTGPVIHGTPWDGKHRLSNDIAVPLRAICILERAETNSIRPITVGEAFPMLLQQLYRPIDAHALEKTLQLADSLAHRTELWRLGCTISREAAQIAFDAMSGRKSDPGGI
ncbi:MAG: hypothetical protein IKH56_03250 [Oscillospiraceae bacterium]|nr:hypothetical protein [Oscillospiraceae bacterium]